MPPKTRVISGHDFVIEDEVVKGAKRRKTEDEPNDAAPSSTILSLKSSKEKPRGHQQRPGGMFGAGTQGRTVFLSSNYFILNRDPKIVFHRYSITISPEAKGKKLAQVIKDALALPQFHALRPGIVSDFLAFLLSTQSLPDSLLKVSVPYKIDHEGKDLNDGKYSTEARSSSNTKDASEVDNPFGSREYSVRFEFIPKVGDTELQESSADQGDLPIVRDLDMILGHFRKSSPNIAIIGKRKVFQLNDPDAVVRQLSALLDARRGYFSSVRPLTAETSVNVNVSYGTFFRERWLHSWLRLMEDHPQVRATGIPGYLKGLRVQLMHLDSKNILRTITGYASPGQGQGYEAHPPGVAVYRAGPQGVEFFEYKSTKPIMGLEDMENARKGILTPHDHRKCGCDGSYISVYDYFKRKYPKYRILDNLPVFNVGNPQHPVYLPSDACKVVVQPAKLKLTPEETDVMRGFAVRFPYLNAESIKNRGFSTLGLNVNNKTLTNFGITISPVRLTLNGHVLPQPKIEFPNRFASYKGSRWNLGGVNFLRAERLNQWAFLNIHEGQRSRSCHDLCVANFLDVLESCDIEASRPQAFDLSKDNVPANLEDVFRKCRPDESKSPIIGILLVVLPKPDSQLYNRIKQLGDVKYGIQTICVTALSDKFYNTSTNPQTNELRSKPYNASVALKVNIKNGGRNHKLIHQNLGFISDGKTMVVGIDVTHPSPGSGSSAPSVAAMVASSDKYLAQWPAEIRINPARQEKVDTLRPMLEAHLEWWEQEHRSYPENLLIYRDGVSEGQYQMVLEEELPQLRAACGSVYRDQRLPRITLIIVGKRHHTRFYRTNESTGEVYKSEDGNPPFGTVVDTTVVDETRNWEFYLQSHTALQGTARPAHYFVLLDEIFSMYNVHQLPKPFRKPSDYLYSITHNMCYLSCRATTSVSIPPPVYYADLACERARRWNSGVFDGSQSEGSTGMELLDSDVTVHEDLKKTMFYI